MTSAPATMQPVTGDGHEPPYHVGFRLCTSLEYADELPKTLWQYTSGAGLTGILTTRTFWGTNCLYMNDRTEFRYAGHVINLVLTEIIDENTSPEVRDELLKLQAMIADAHPDVTPDLFICSFSARHDHLSLWRSYTRAGDAYSVGIDGMYLWMRGLRSWQLRRCFYDVDEQRTIFRYAINDRLEQLKRDDQLWMTLRALAYDFAWLAPLVKDPCWSDEQEWRLIRYPAELVRFPESGTPVVNTRSGAFGVAPYTTFPLDGDPLSLRVTIGPGPTPSLTANDIIEMGVKSGVVAAVDSSKRPIRGW